MEPTFKLISSFQQIMLLVWKDLLKGILFESEILDNCGLSNEVTKGS